ncbi:MAG: GTPase HflX [Thermoanaerobaculia bacterium]
MGQSVNAARPQKAILVALVLRSASRSSTIEHLDELERLAATAGAECVARVMQDRPSPDPATWIGKGKAEEIKALAVERGADIVIFDDDLTAAQARNLEKIVEKQVIDRSGLILDIFVRHARSREARTQVELAQLNYMLPRLTRAWTHLERQAGGIGTRGVGETQLEIDRRLIRHRIAKLKEELKHIEKTRDTQRRGRREASTVALVGYTNAGKSTLFNRLAGGAAYAANQLFATLDAKLQKAAFDAPRETVMIDTVGFIRKLPHHLVASFRSTMEEAASADLVLHVIDASHPVFEEQRTVGNEVLTSLGVEPANVIEVYNKSDLPLGVEDGDLPLSAIRVSALTGEGLERLIEAICERQFASGRLVRLDIPSSEGRLLARLYEVARIHRQTPHDGGVDLIAWVPEEQEHVFKPFEVGEAGQRP